MSKPKEVIKLGFCPRCKKPLDESTRMKTVVRDVEFCYLCSLDLTDNPNDSELADRVLWAKQYKEMM